MSRLPRVSFIIPTLNAERFLDLCLSAISNQNYPQKLIEIVVADAGSTDKTLAICKKHNARVIANPEVLHEPGKDRAANAASGEILFFTDADNILASDHWLISMIQPYIKYPQIKGFLPQTIADPADNSLNRYLSWLSTDPFTWFAYGKAATPRTWGSEYRPYKSGEHFQIFKFTEMNHPLLGLSQGFGVTAGFKREKAAHSDDILAGIKLIAEGGLIVYVPEAKIYHYHVGGWGDFVRKYRWRVRNNLTQKIPGMGLVNRGKYMNLARKVRQMLFIPYSLSLVWPLVDTLKLIVRYKDSAMCWHPFACLGLAVLILKEVGGFLFTGTNRLGVYGE